MRRIVLAVLLVALGSPLAAQDKAADVMKEMRKALGGDKLESVKSLSLEGPFQRDAGQRQMSGTSALTIQLPDTCIAVRKPSCLAARRWSASSRSTARRRGTT